MENKNLTKTEILEKCQKYHITYENVIQEYIGDPINIIDFEKVVLEFCNKHSVEKNLVYLDMYFESPMLKTTKAVPDEELLEEIFKKEKENTEEYKLFKKLQKKYGNK